MSNLLVTRFRLLDLPVELQRLIFLHYFDGRYDITLEYERLTMLRSRFHVRGVPPCDLLLVSKHVHKHAAPLRQSLFTGRLILHSVFILVTLRRSDRFNWIKAHTRILHFSDSSVHPERWNRYYICFPELQRLEIDFPTVKRLEAVNLDEILNGKEDDLLVASMDAFQLSLVDQLREQRIEVILSQRYCLKDGLEGWRGTVVSVYGTQLYWIYLIYVQNVGMRPSEDGMQVLSRRHTVDEHPSLPTTLFRSREL